MPTIVHFVGRDQILVREDETEVQAAFAGSAGGPAALTHHRSGRPVYINLGQVTYWQGRGGGRDMTPLRWPAIDRATASR
jgi:hypothetical protein